MRRFYRVCVIVGLLSSSAVLLADNATDAERIKFFESKVRPLLAAKCVHCHGEKKQKSDLRLDSLAAVLKGGESGIVVVPGEPQESLLIEAINYESVEMPPTGKLDAESIAVLTRWVKIGAPWPDHETNMIRIGAKAGFSDADRSHWALQPVGKPPVPDIGAVVAEVVKLQKDQDEQARVLTNPATVANRAAWIKNPIDNFMLARMLREGLTPAPEADRRTLIRRLYLDLIGLPPSPEEMDEWSRRLAETSATEAVRLRPDSPNSESSRNRLRVNEEAYLHLVDHLLDSPHYGERWARHWLDVVRYAESDGFADHYRQHAWRYRDYIVRSFNDDKPYDQFIREQIAGDELAPHDPDVLAATTFLRLGVYEFNLRDARGQWTRITDEITDVVGEAILGLSIGCARCHDHKFDPILRQDYYRLRAFFTPMLWRDDVPIATAKERADYRQAQVRWESKTAEIRRQIKTVTQPSIREVNAVKRFPEDIQLIYYKRPQERSAFEEQLAHLVKRQVIYDQENEKQLRKTLKGKQREQWYLLRTELAAFDQYKPEPLPSVMSVRDSQRPIPPSVIPDDPKRREIPPGFLSVLDARPAKIDPAPSAPQSSGRRTVLARWLTRPENPLTARVIVNRLWQQHFGRGIVATSSEFGRMGQPPTHPELLDFLARQLVSSPSRQNGETSDTNQPTPNSHESRDDPDAPGYGWRLKPLHKLIVTSATYRQSVFHPEVERFAEIDPENKLRWRADIRRLDGEQVRDALLAVSGELDLCVGGEGVTPEQPRRSIYLRSMRNSPDILLRAFDGVSGYETASQRYVTITPSQTLLMLNGPYVLDRAKKLARRVIDESVRTDAERMERAYQLVFGRRPEAEFRARLLSFLEQQARHADANPVDSASSKDVRYEALVDLCHVLLNSNEFLFME